MSVFVSVAVGTVYGLYAFGVLGSGNTKYCLANQVDYHPYPYKSQKDMMEFLDQLGTVNVTDRFDTVIRFGFISNLIFLVYQIYKMGMNRKRKQMDCTMLCLGVCVTLIWVIQFAMVISFRFSHTGYVCAGDFAEDQLIMSNMEQRAPVGLDRYNAYYLRSEGDFLYYYIVACVVLFFTFFLCACCTGTCLFFLGSATSLQMVEQVLKEFDKIPEVMRAKAQGGRPQSEDPAGGFPGAPPADDENAFRGQFKND